jgi:hypothetical protein
MMGVKFEEMIAKKEPVLQLTKVISRSIFTKQCNVLDKTV